MQSSSVVQPGTDIQRQARGRICRSARSLTREVAALDFGSLDLFDSLDNEDRVFR